MTLIGQGRLCARRVSGATACGAGLPPAPSAFWLPRARFAHPLRVRTPGMRKETAGRLASTDGVWRRPVVAADRCAIALTGRVAKSVAKMCHEGNLR